MIVQMQLTVAQVLQVDFLFFSAFLPSSASSRSLFPATLALFLVPSALGFSSFFAAPAAFLPAVFFALVFALGFAFSLSLPWF
jgi:hypothetical protein